MTGGEDQHERTEAEMGSAMRVMSIVVLPLIMVILLVMLVGLTTGFD